MMNHWDDDFLLGGVAVAKEEESIGKVEGGVLTGDIVGYLDIDETLVLVDHRSTIEIDGSKHLGAVVGREAVGTNLAVEEVGRAVVYQMLVVGARSTSGLFLRASVGASPKERTEKNEKQKTKPAHSCHS